MRGLSPAPGTLLWLVRHDLRLAWRGFAAMFAFLVRPGRTAIAVVAGFVALHLVAWPVAHLALPILDRLAEDGLRSPALLTILAAVFCWMTAQGVLAVTRALFTRSDLDLLLGSPVSTRTVLGARLLAITVSTLGSVGLLVLPVADMAAMLGRPHWLLAYVVLALLALAGTTAGLLLTLVINRLVGPRRARMASHLAATLFASAFVLGAQIWLVLSDASRTAILEALAVARSGVGFGIPASFSLSAWTVAVVLTVVVLAAFAATVLLAASPFARAALAGGSGTSAGGPGRVDAQPHRFATGFGRNVRLKEWRLLRRDPSLFGQLALQIVYTLPVAVMLSTGEQRLPVEMALAPAIVVIAAQVCASLAWIAVSAEEAPELISTAPTSQARVDRLKLTAVLAPVLLIVAAPLVGLALVSLRAAVLTVIIATLAAASTALLNLWHPMPGNRRGMLRRHQQSKLVGMVEHALAIVWAITIVIAIIVPWLAIAPALLVAGILWAMAPFKMADVRQTLSRHLRRPIGATG